MLCGRVAETSRIDALLAGARAGRSGVLVLVGNDGVGRSTLLGHAASAAVGMSVVWVRGSWTARRLAYGGLAQLVVPRADVLDHLPEAQAAVLRGAVGLGAPVAAERFAVYAAAVAFLARIAEWGPLLVAVDDLDRLDPGSAEAIAFVGRRLLAEGIALLVATGDDDATTDGLPRCPVPGLTVAEVAAWVHAATGVAPADRVVRGLVEQTGGSPAAIRAVLGRLTPEQLSGAVEAHPAAPARALFAARVDACTAPARALLLLFALSAGPLAHVLDAARAEGLDAALAEVEATGLVVLDGTSFDFCHPSARAAIVDAAAPADRRAAHRRLAAVLTEGAPGDAADRRAWHLADGALGADEPVAAMLDALAERSRRRGGHATAVAALERAAQLSDTNAARARRLYAAAFDAQLAGRTGHAEELLVAADAVAHEPGLRTRIAARRGWVELVAGRPAVAHRIVRRAADDTPDTDPLRLQLLTDAAITALLAGDPVGALDAIAEAEKSRTPPTATSMLVVKAWHGMVHLHLGNLVDGLALVREAAAVAALPPDRRPSPDYVTLVAYGMTWIGMHHKALAMLTPVVADLRASGSLALLPFALSATAQAEARVGRLAAARSTALEAVELSRLVDDGFWRYLALSTVALVLAMRGEETGCRRYAAEALALRRPGTDYSRDATEALALLELGLGRPDAALDAFRAAPPSPGGAESDEETHPDYVEAYLRVHEVPTAAMRVRLRDVATDGAAPLHAAIARRLTGLAAPEAADPHFQAALREHDRVPCPFEKARTLLAYGERVRRSGRGAEARRHLRAALDTFDRLGARSWARRARTELAAAGGEVPPAGTASALEDLTAREYGVARLAVTGAGAGEIAAALFLSAPTVEHHLGQVYRKLRVRDPDDLANRYPGLTP
ncbi:AAA family ATPase [Virgisporangium ochraceum]|uniref:Helix-turn-helix transcriptional regulator n=1 Tax=Virgisporangium ochraceum TaxID=65505 RepID=A0A8J4EG86_9ACTN|nr:AAA family ATPase [Virgisporangium ochraceum]GIJ73644.1 helix-turn-helix transcriptional regulator [Virgisporangium ochraceum]